MLPVSKDDIEYAPNGFPASRVTITGRAPNGDAQLLLDLESISQEILAAEGNLGLVAEKLLGHKSKTNEILAAITADAQALDSFSIKVRAYAMIKLIGVYAEMATVVMAQISHLPVKDAAKALSDIGRVLGELSDKKSAPVTNNNFATFLGALPIEVRNALDVLVDVKPDGSISSKMPALQDPDIFEGEVSNEFFDHPASS